MISITQCSIAATSPGYSHSDDIVKGTRMIVLDPDAMSVFRHRQLPAIVMLCTIRLPTIKVQFDCQPRHSTVRQVFVYYIVYIAVATRIQDCMVRRIQSWSIVATATCAHSFGSKWFNSATSETMFYLALSSVQSNSPQTIQLVQQLDYGAYIVRETDFVCLIQW